MDYPEMFANLRNVLNFNWQFFELIGFIWNLQLDPLVCSLGEVRAELEVPILVSFSLQNFKNTPS